MSRSVVPKCISVGGVAFETWSVGEIFLPSASSLPIRSINDGTPSNRRTGLIQHQDVGSGRDRQVLPLGLQPLGQARAGGDVAPRRAARRHDPGGVDAELVGVCPDPPHRTLGILDASIRGDALPRFHPVIGPRGDHAPAGQVIGLRLELGDPAIGPAAAEEEDDGRSLIGLASIPAGSGPRPPAGRPWSSCR